MVFQTGCFQEIFDDVMIQPDLGNKIHCLLINSEFHHIFGHGNTTVFFRAFHKLGAVGPERRIV